MSNEDIERIVAALNRAPPASSPLVAAMSGADVDTVRRFVATEVEKSNERFFAEMRSGMAALSAKIEEFLPDDEIEKRIVMKFERIGLRVDDDHYEETGNAVRGFLKWHKRADKVLGGIAISILGAIVIAVLKLVGINIPTAPGN